MSFCWSESSENSKPAAGGLFQGAAAQRSLRNGSGERRRVTTSGPQFPCRHSLQCLPGSWKNPLASALGLGHHDASAPVIIWRWGSLGLVDGEVFCGTAVISFSVLVTHWAASLEVLF